MRSIIFTKLLYQPDSDWASLPAAVRPLLIEPLAGDAGGPRRGAKIRAETANHMID